MNPTENRNATDRVITTADLAAAGRPAPPEDAGLSHDDRDDSAMRERQLREEHTRDNRRNSTTPNSATQSEKLAPLFQPREADEYRSRWAAIQGSFVDDPKAAAQKGDELVAQVMQTLAENFAREREHLDRELSQTGEASTEALRVALRRYRSFFERLLSL